LDLIEAELVRINDPSKSIAFWIENITVDSEAVGGPILRRGDSSPKPKDWDLFICVIVLKDRAH